MQVVHPPVSDSYWHLVVQYCFC